MKNTHTSLYRSQIFSLKEGRLLYEWGANPETGGSSDAYVNEANEREMRQYVREEKRNPLSDAAANTQRLAFLNNLSDAEVGAIQFEKKFKIKFGIDDDGEYVVLTKKPALLEKLLQDPEDGEGVVYNNNGSYTITTMTGGKKIELVIDSLIFEALSSHASVTVDGIPPIAKNAIPPKEPQKGRYINDYIKASIEDNRILDLGITDKKLTDFGSDKYAKMVDAVVRTHPEAIQFVMTEWAKTNVTPYSTLWEKSITAKPELLQHLTGDKITAVSNYPYLCRIAAAKNPHVIQFVDFDIITDLNDQKFIINIAMNAGSDVQALLPERLKSIARKLRQNTLLAKEASAVPTEDEKAQVKESIIEDPNDIEYLKDLIESRPRLIHAISDTGWVSSHENEYKDLWRTAIHEYPAVITMPDTLAALKQYHKGKKVFDFYTELAKAAATAHEVGQRSEDGSYLPLHVDPEWRKERPDDFRALFIENGAPKGKYSLLMLLNVDEAEEAFNNTKAGKNLLGYPTALYTAMNEENLANVIRAGQSEFASLKKQLNKLPNLQARFDEVLQQTLIKYPELQNEFTFADKDVLKAKFNDRQTIVTALATGRNIFIGLDVKDVQAFKSNVFKVLKDPTEQPENLAALFTYMPPEWKTTSADLKELVSANASLYKLLDEQQRLNYTIFGSALNAHLTLPLGFKGALDWVNDVPQSIRNKMGETVPATPDISPLLGESVKKELPPSGIEQFDEDKIDAIDTTKALDFMKAPGEVPVSVFVSLMKHDAPVLKDPRFLHEAMNTYDSVYQFVVSDASAVGLRENIDVQKYITNKIQSNISYFVNLPDEIKNESTYLISSIKQWGAGPTLLRLNFKKDNEFKKAMDSVFGSLNEEEQYTVARQSTVYDLPLVNDRIRIFIIKHNLELAIKATSEVERVTMITDMFAEAQTTERDETISKLVSSLDIEHAANLFKSNSDVFKHLSWTQKANPYIMNVAANFVDSNSDIKKAIQFYFQTFGFDKQREGKKHPQLSVEYDKYLDGKINGNSERDTLVEDAKKMQVQFAVYADKAYGLEVRQEYKALILGWKGFAAEGLNAEIANSDTTEVLQEHIDTMNVVLNVSTLIESGRLNWTKTELQTIEDSRAVPLIQEIQKRIQLVAVLSAKNPVIKELIAYHNKNIVNIFERLSDVEILPPDAVEALNAIKFNTLDYVQKNALPKDFPGRVLALQEKWTDAEKNPIPVPPKNASPADELKVISDETINGLMNELNSLKQDRNSKQ